VNKLNTHTSSITKLDTKVVGERFGFSVPERYEFKKCSLQSDFLMSHG